MKSVYFISDLHLGAKYLANPRGNELRVVRFLESITPNARELYLLGDVLDYWYEYKSVVPRGHVRFLGQLARMADAGVKITWLTGNHDVWLFDYLSDEIGLTVLKRHTQLEIGGKQFFLSHGDDVGYQKPSYRFMRFCFYNRVCQWLYAGIHPRITSAVATGWSTQNRVNRKAGKVSDEMKKSARHLLDFAREYASGHPEVDYFMFGHLHLAQDTPLDDRRRVIFLGDWISQFTYAVFDGEKLSLERYAE